MDENRQQTQDETATLSVVVVTLLRGILYREEKGEVWNMLLNLQARVRDYVAVLGLELILDEAEGYAFLRSKADDDLDDKNTFPRLMRRQQLSFPVSLLLALLRKKMAEFDAAGGEGDSRLIVSKDDIVELLRVFLPSGSNETRVIDQVGAHLNKVVKMGFVRQLKGQQKIYEVRRILKAFVDAQWLNEFDKQLAVYQQEIRRKNGSDDE